MSDSQVAELVQPEVAEPRLPLELTKSPNKSPKKNNKKTPVQPKDAGPLQPLELSKTPKKNNKSAEFVETEIEDASTIQCKAAEPLQPLELTKTPKKLNKSAELVQPKVVEPIQPIVVEPVRPKVAEPFQLENAAAVQSDVEPVQSKVAESVEPKVVEPVQPKVVELVQSENAAPVQSNVDPVQPKVAKPVQPKVAEPVQPKVAEPVQSEVEEPVQAVVGESVQSDVGVPAPSNIAQPSKPKEVTKFTIRRTVWDQLYRNKLVLYPLPFGRIPNFIGTELASAKLLELDVFQKAKSVQVNPDKPLESARLLVLNNEKDLYVPCPGLNRSLMIKLEPDQDHDVKSIVTRWGIDNLGKRIHMKDEVSIDLMVTGSVAVSEDGYRIGKGQGYTDMEFAVLKDMKAIDNNTIIVTIVHDSQVMDLPKDIFKEYDVPVDYILTPTRIIEVKHNLPKPEGIIWTEFTERQLKFRKFFRELKQIHEREGRDTTLKVETPEDHYTQIPHRKWPYAYKKRRPRSRPVDDETKHETIARNRKPAVKPEKVNPPRSTPVKNASSTSMVTEPSEDIENIPPSKKPKKKKKKQQIDYSLKVSNIEKTVRLRDLKMALKERGIKPNKIAWKGSRGYCYLNYSKKKQKKESEGEGDGPDEGSDAINSVIEMIQELKIHSEKCFIVKVMEPITRIETMNVTAV